MPALTPREGGAPLWYVSCVLLLLLLLLSSWRWRAFFSCSFMLQGVRKKNNAGVKQFGQVPIVFEFPSVATGAREGKSKISYQPPVGGTSKSAL